VPGLVRFSGRRRLGTLTTLWSSCLDQLHLLLPTTDVKEFGDTSNRNYPRLGDGAVSSLPSENDKSTDSHRYRLMARAHPRALVRSLTIFAGPFCFGLLFDLSGTRTVPHDFMEISSQVLAVLILALAVQTRLLSIARWEKLDDRMESIALAAALFFGEIAPLAALLCNTNSVILATPAAYAIIISLGLIVTYAMFGKPRPTEPVVTASQDSTTLNGDDSSARVSIRWL
jgi:hypothetical protein